MPTRTRPRSRHPATPEPAPGIPTKSTIGFVKGKLKRDRREQLRLRVTKAVDTWIDAAYVAGDYPRNDFSDAFKAFSKGAAALAKRDKGLMSNAEVGDRVDTVTAKARRLRIDVLADQRQGGGGHRLVRAGARRSTARSGAPTGSPAGCSSATPAATGRSSATT